MLQIIQALFFISAFLPRKEQDDRSDVEGQTYPLDMALDSVDDRYSNCRKKMARLVKSKYLKEELNKLDNFKEAWDRCKKKVTFKWNSKLKKVHKIALFVYSDPLSRIYLAFNTDTRNGKQNYRAYKWHSLHFLLTDAIHILNKTKKRNKCYDTFRGTNATFDENVLNKEVRFGSFTSSSLNQSKAKGFGQTSCFEIHTCEGANVTKYSLLPREEEVLIPPYETFRVTAVKTRTDNGDLWCHTVFELKSTGIKSDLNCGLFKKL